MGQGLEDRFHRAMQLRYVIEIPKATGYRPARMIDMIGRHGALHAVRLLMVEYATHPSEGYTQLWMRQRLDLSFEALMHDPEFAPLFTDRERAWACQRLAEYQYTPPGGCITSLGQSLGNE